jgi:hypothetical protein
MSDSTRERIYHVVDLDTGEKLLRRDIMAECQYEAQNLTRKKGEENMQLREHGRFIRIECNVN